MKMMAKSLIRIGLVGSLAFAGTFDAARAQTIIEMASLKCGDYLEAPPERQEWIFQRHAKHAHGRFETICDKQTAGRKILQGAQERQLDECHSQGGDLINTPVRPKTT
jgi:hypothetical protein